MPNARRFVLLVVLLTAAQVGQGQTEYETLREPALRRLGAYLHAGRIAAARRDLQTHLAQFPGDAVMQYNLACVTAMAGDADSALVHVAAALAAGYRDFHRIRTGPDLALLVNDPRLHALLDSTWTAAVSRMQALEFTLTEAVWSDPLALLPESGNDSSPAVAGTVRFGYDRQELRLEVTCDDDEHGEFFACVAIPHSLEQFETTRWFEFRADCAAPPTAALIGRHGSGESRPGAARLERAAAGWLLSIPWTSLHPHRPPLDLVLGLNVVLRRSTDPSGPAARWGLISDPYAGSRLQPWRRFVPVQLDPGDRPSPLVAGRLDTYLVIGDELSAELGLQGVAAGPATVALRTGSDELSLAAAVDSVIAVDLEADLCYLTIDYDLEALPAAGWFTVGVELVDAGGARYQWHDRGFRLPADWFVRQRERLAAVSEAEQSIVQYHLFGTLRGQQAFRPHDDPARVAAAALETMDMLDRFAATGSVLPQEPVQVEAGFPSGDDALLACRLVLPDAAVRSGGPAVLVITPDRDITAQIAAALASGRLPGDPRLFLVASLPQRPDQPDWANQTVEAAAAWLGDLTEPRELSLVGIAAGAEMALHAAAALPSVWRSVLLVAGSAFDPLVLADPQEAAADLAPRLASLPVCVYLPADAGPRARALVRLLDGKLEHWTVEWLADNTGGASAWAALVLADR
ncbi:MAG: hypothetical protein RBT60_00225 [Candidatus Krumholzibacteria bacterium]|jgi:hypothetical protein|nr:hypothetical protein [Candidatus Krumholzibacteria bacterium]